MSKYVRTIYFYVVSFITLCMIIVGIVGIVSELTEYLYPTVYVYFSNDYSVEKYNIEYQKALEMDKRTNLKEMFTYVATLVVGTPLFIYHFKTTKEDLIKEV